MAHGPQINIIKFCVEPMGAVSGCSIFKSTTYFYTDGCHHIKSRRLQWIYWIELVPARSLQKSLVTGYQFDSFSNSLTACVWLPSKLAPQSKDVRRNIESFEFLEENEVFDRVECLSSISKHTTNAGLMLRKLSYLMQEINSTLQWLQ